MGEEARERESKYRLSEQLSAGLYTDCVLFPIDI
uniref:Uncharacterized protein n=1 Tax=Amphimedon queenslandica TaxID=400682 RepID=A0A1X7VWD5_AMPQE